MASATQAAEVVGKASIPRPDHGHWGALHRKPWVAAVGLFGIVCGCGAPLPEAKDEATYPARRQCLSLVDGRASMEDAAVVLLLTKSLSQCTGTFVADNTLVTAAHCADASEDGGLLVILDDCANDRSIQVRASRVIRSAGAPSTGGDGTLSGEMAEVDLAVALLPSGSAPAVVSLSPRPIQKGDELRMVGFGSDRPYDEAKTAAPRTFQDVTKRVGDDQAEDEAGTEALFIAVQNAGDARLSTGDSGGPVLVDGRIAGIASFVSLATDGRSQLTGWVNLHSAKSRAALIRAKSEGATFEGWDAYAAFTPDAPPTP